MWSFIGRMFGSQKAGEAIIDGVSSGVDKMFYTAEEKADDAAQARREGMAVYMEWLKSTSGSRLARRFLALIITMPWALANFVSLVLDAVAPFISGVEQIPRLVGGDVVMVTVLGAEKWGLAADSLAENAAQNNALVGVVLLFYFGGPAAIDGVKGLVAKWANKGAQTSQQAPA